MKLGCVVCHYTAHPYRQQEVVYRTVSCVSEGDGQTHFSQPGDGELGFQIVKTVFVVFRRIRSFLRFHPAEEIMESFWQAGTRSATIGSGAFASGVSTPNSNVAARLNSHAQRLTADRTMFIQQCLVAISAFTFR